MNKLVTVHHETTLLTFLFESFPDLKKTRVKQLLKFRCISINGKISTQFDQQLFPGDQVQVFSDKNRPTTPAEQFNLEIVYEDDAILVINKPAGLLTVGSEKVPRETAIFALNAYLNKKSGSPSAKQQKFYQKKVFVVHRIDRDVSGLVIFAKSEEVKFTLQANWEKVRKEYYAVVEGCPKKKSDTLISYLSENQFLRVYSGPKNPAAKKAVTHYEVLKVSKNYSLLRVQIDTGRKHQIRVQLAEIGHPIVGDKNYGAGTNPMKRIALHACFLEFDHPITGRKISFHSDLPKELKLL